MLKGLPKCLGFTENLQPKLWLCNFQGKPFTSFSLLLFLHLSSQTPLSVTAWAFPDISSSTIWVLFKAESPFWGALDTSNFSTEFPALLQPYDSATEQGPHTAGCNPALLQGPTASPLIPVIWGHLGTVRPAPALPHVLALCSWWACSSLVGFLGASG